MIRSSYVEAFRTVMLSGSTTAAARLLHTSQPNVSRSIAKLEKHTGLHLFDRLPGKLVPTKDGRSFFKEVQSSFIGLQRLDDAARRIRRFSGSFLRIAAIQTLAVGLLPRTIARFAAIYPDAHISIHTGHSSAVTQWIDDDSCDIGIVSFLNDHPGFDHEQLYQLNGICLMPAGHRLAARACIRPADLIGESYISFPQNEKARFAIDAVFDHAGVDRRINFETPYSSIACSLVGQGLGVAIVNPIVAQDFRHMDLVTRPFEPAIKYTATLIYPKERPRERLAASLVDMLKRVTQEEVDALAALQRPSGGKAPRPKPKRHINQA